MYRPTDWPTDTRSWSVTVVVVMYVIDTNTYTHPQPSPSSRRHTTVSWLTNTVYTVRYGSHLLIDSGMLFVPTSCTCTACCTFSCPFSFLLTCIPSCCCCCCCCRHIVALLWETRRACCGRRSKRKTWHSRVVKKGGCYAVEVLSLSLSFLLLLLLLSSNRSHQQ